MHVGGASPILANNPPASVAKTAVRIVLNLLFESAQSLVIPVLNSLKTVLYRE